MGERKAVNKYFPPDYDPRMGSLDKYHGIHPLRERAKKIHEGILVIRFEMPYNIWCNGCEKHIGMGVRYNAEKQKIGKYYTTPIYKFRMKCHLCDQYFEIKTDPKNCDYEILSGCRRKEERWDTEKAGNVQTTHREVKQKMMANEMYKLEHQAVDKGIVQKLAPTLGRLQEIRDVFDDDFYVNQVLRKQFREQKKELQTKSEKDNNLKRKICFPLDFKLANETKEDGEIAKKISYGIKEKNVSLETRKKQMKESSVFGIPSNSKMALAKSLVTKSKDFPPFTALKTYSSAVDIGIKVRSKHAKEGETIENAQVNSGAIPNELDSTKDLMTDGGISTSTADSQVSTSTCQSLVPDFVDTVSEEALINTNNTVTPSDSPDVSKLPGYSKSCSVLSCTSVTSKVAIATDHNSDTVAPLQTVTYCLSATDSQSASSFNADSIEVFKDPKAPTDKNKDPGVNFKLQSLEDIDEQNYTPGDDDSYSTKGILNLNANTDCTTFKENVVKSDSTVISDSPVINTSPLQGKRLISNTSLVDYCSSSSGDENN